MSRVSLESQEARWLTQWAKLHEHRFPELGLLFHICNEQASKWARMNGAAVGIKPGVPDYCLPVVRSGPGDGDCGLWIELKRMKGGFVSHEQDGWAARLRQQGYSVVFAKGWIEAARAICEYLSLPASLVGDYSRDPLPTHGQTSENAPTRKSGASASKRKPFSPRTARPAKIIERKGIV